jgi:hypothetical protein
MMTETKIEYKITSNVEHSAEVQCDGLKFVLTEGPNKSVRVFQVLASGGRENLMDGDLHPMWALGKAMVGLAELLNDKGVEPERKCDLRCPKGVPCNACDNEVRRGWRTRGSHD